MVIDAHAHMFTMSMSEGMLPKNFDIKNIPKEFINASKHTIKENTDAWLNAMDMNGIEKTIFMANVNFNKDFTAFINSSSRFIGFAKINPTKPDAIDTLKKEIENGMSGVKLYPTNEGFNVGSKEAYQFYDYCEKKHIPIVIHFGVTIGFRADLINGNPLTLSTVLTDFPGINFVIAHFGAGFFRETLMLRYKRQNLYVDTSGTNNWMQNQDNFLTLKDVFKKSIEVFDDQHIIYGSDTRIFPAGYRENILKEQTNILKELGLKREAVENIMHNNAKNILLTHF